MTPRALAAVLTGCLVLAACGGDPGSDDSVADGEGSLVMATLEGIVERDIETGETETLVESDNASTFFLDVDVSPDGAQLAYTVQPPAQTIDGRYDAGSDLWIADRDGSNARRIFEHVDPSQLVRYPQWDGADSVLAVIQEYVDDAGLTRVDYTVQRIDIATGARERVLDDALTYTIAPEGAELAYARLSPLRGENLEVKALPDGPIRTLLDPTQQLSPFNSPRYSPDGVRIAFAAADQSTAPTPPGAPTESAGRRSAGRSPGLPAPATDGLPQDVWVIAADGGEPALIAPLQEDFPSLAWNGDGTHIYVLGAYGLYDVNVANGNYATIGEGAFHGSIDWAPELP